MKKFIYGIVISIMICMVTGCGEGQDKYDLYKYTEWTDTNGYIIQIREDDCLVGRDGRAFDQVCLFEANASGSGVGKITLCNNAGLDCESQDLLYLKTSFNSNDSIFIYDRAFYYTGKVKRN